MALTIVQPALLRFVAQAVLTAAAAEARLFKNNHYPAPSDVLTDYVECDFSGYVGPRLITWGIAVPDGDFASKNVAEPLRWERDAGATSNQVYGIYFLDASGAVSFAERFLAPVLMENEGDEVEFFPIIRMSS